MVINRSVTGINFRCYVCSSGVHAEESDRRCTEKGKDEKQSSLSSCRRRSYFVFSDAVSKLPQHEVSCYRSPSAISILVDIDYLTP